MDDFNIVIYIGYAGSVLVALSLMMSSLVRLRIINLIGASIFATYGFLIGAMPVAFLNSFIALVDIYYLIEIFSAREYFKVLEVKPDSYYLKYFCEFHAKEINKFQPTFRLVPDKNVFTFFILRNSVPAGLVVASPRGEEEVFINLDYAAPGYRDFKMGKYVINQVFKKKNVKRLSSDPGNPVHEKYLKRMGFKKIDKDSEVIYRLSL